MKVKDALVQLSNMNPESELGTTDSDIGEFLVNGLTESTYDDANGTHEYVEVELIPWD